MMQIESKKKLGEVAASDNQVCDKQLVVTVKGIALLSIPLWFPLLYMMLAAVENHTWKSSVLSSLSIPIGIVALLIASSPLLATSAFPWFIKAAIWCLYVALSTVFGTVFGIAGFYTAQNWFR